MAKQSTGMLWLRKQMSRNGYTSLQEVADAAEMHRGNLWRYFCLETRPSIDVLPRLASALDVTVMEVLDALRVERVK